MSGTYEATTRGIRVTVQPQYLADRSSPKDGQWVWTYEVRLENHGQDTVQLLTRHWLIVDGNGTKEEVRGAGVVGDQPRLDPGESYTYTSGCPLKTPSGFMSGSYGMVDGEGQAFDVEIPAFALDLPNATTGALN
ncbi:MAG: Co2+/Mg2+ efflux protein ApaG [Pseudomonadota bacterium]